MWLNLTLLTPMLVFYECVHTILCMCFLFISCLVICVSVFVRPCLCVHVYASMFVRPCLYIHVCPLYWFHLFSKQWRLPSPSQHSAAVLYVPVSRVSVVLKNKLNNFQKFLKLIDKNDIECDIIFYDCSVLLHKLFETIVINFVYCWIHSDDEITPSALLVWCKDY